MNEFLLRPVITVPSIGSRRSQHHFHSLLALVQAKADTRGKQHD
jgi:hypothetical protein